jgi:hypothetical protein
LTDGGDIRSSHALFHVLLLGGWLVGVNKVELGLLLLLLFAVRGVTVIISRFSR